MVKILRVAVLMLALSTSLFAQNSSTCGVALSRLQSYVDGVNSFANAEYYRNIPQRCAAPGPWGYYVNSQCAQSWLQQLNAWYANQAAMVNQWYYQINQQCSSRPSTREIPVRRSPEGPPTMDEDATQRVQIDDEDRTVQIKIPTTPEGYRRYR